MRDMKGNLKAPERAELEKWGEKVKLLTAV
jgi:hypothetical protein